MSFLMLLNKLHRAEDVHRVAQLAADSANDILKDSPDDVVDIVAGAAMSIFRKMNVPENEADGYIRRFRKDRKVGVLFENFEKVDIQKERQRTKEAVDALNAEKESHDKDLKELKKKDDKLKEKDDKLKEKDDKLKEKDDKLKEQEAALRLAVQRLAASGDGAEEIAEFLNLGAEKVKNLLGE